VAGSAAGSVNPHRPEEIREAMQSVLSDEKLYDAMKEKGIAQAEKFSWKKSAKKTLDIIQIRE
jgi:glycosyltransferase involved in cell wall biosynthesis